MQVKNEDGAFTCWRSGHTSKNAKNMHLDHRITLTSKNGNLDSGNVALEGAACNFSAGNSGYAKEGMTCIERGSCGAPYGQTD